MKRKTKVRGSHGRDNPLKTAQGSKGVTRKPGRIANPSRRGLGSGEEAQPLRLKGRTLPRLSKEERKTHSRTAEYLRANPGEA